MGFMDDPSQFRNLPFDTRLGAMGDQAEGAFEAWATLNKRGFCRYGLNRPPIRMDMIGKFLCYTPDYLTSKALVEVQGFGRDQTFKLKCEKLDALEQWQEKLPVEFFAYDSTNKRSWIVPLDVISQGVNDNQFDIASFPEGKNYHKVPAQFFMDVTAAGF